MLQGQQSSLNVIKKAEGHMGIDIKELEQNWGLYMQEVDDKPAVIRTNLALLELAPIEEYTQRIQFAVYYRTPTERGLPRRTRTQRFGRWRIPCMRAWRRLMSSTQG